jgi:TetR/AcrR family transcriptional regulator, regulator of cefoperazone and chloramphenicol sensitivity
MTGSTAVHADPETRKRLLNAAERLFSERGFKAVTVREICGEAGANVAAVNYHFGDKLALYREVLQVAIGAMREATEGARQAGAGQAADEKLRRYIALFLNRLFAPGRETIHKLIDREMADPTPALDDLVQQGVRPRLEYLSGVIAEMIGCEQSDRRVMLCVMSVQSQSLMYARRNPIAERLGFIATPAPADIDAAARHIAAFSIAGIRAVGQDAPAKSTATAPAHSIRRRGRPAR